MWVQLGGNPTQFMLTRKQAHGHALKPEAGKSHLGGCPGEKRHGFGGNTE